MPHFQVQSLSSRKGDNMNEMFIDNFAGGGGASTGIELAIGRSVDVAINHDPAAIAMHTANHPNTKHYCESVWDINPRDVAGDRPVGLVWLSPDCTHHSKARGGKPREKGIRGLAWVAVRWAATVKPRVMMLENVEEFMDWGPLDNEGKPIKKDKGRTFDLFVKSLKKQGYAVEWRILKACDYGAPTTRKRLFMVARCDGRPIVWPAPPYTSERVKVGQGKQLPYRVAAEIIDWSIPCPSIFERKRPLAENTMRRIARGIQKFVIDSPNPFIVRIGQTGFGGDRMSYSLDQPLTTITSKNEHMLISPTLIQSGYGEREGQAPRVLDLNKPMGTAVAGGIKQAMVSAMLIQYHSETMKHEVRGQELSNPIMTLDTSNRYALVSSHLIKFKGTNIGQKVTDPLQTITGVNHFGEVRAFLMAYYGASVGSDLNKPLGTVTTHDRFGLVMVHGTPYQIVDIGMRMLVPRELYNGQGFPSTYIINPMYNGKPFTQAEQVAKCGNSVSPVIPDALVRANMPECCIASGEDRYSRADWELMMA
jgi:DNA (cytosine-5)-methyltransferase 1